MNPVSHVPHREDLNGSWITVDLDWPRTSVGRDQGLPSVQVHRVAQDARGHLWLVGPSGLSRYDGTRVRVFTPQEGLSTQGLRSIATDASGRLWVGTDVGVDVMEPDGRIHAPFPDWAAGFVERIVVHEDTIWLGGSQGLFKWHSGTGLEPDPDPRFRNVLVHALVVDRSGRLWAGGPQLGLLCLEHGHWREPENAAWSRIGTLCALACSSDGSILVGGDRGVARIHTDGAVQHPLGNAAGVVTAMLQVEDEWWLGIGSELRRYRERNGTWQAPDVVLMHSQINDLMLDNVGNIWAATENAGACKISVLRHALLRPLLPGAGGVFSVRRGQGTDMLVGGEHSSWRLRWPESPDAPVQARHLEPLQGRKVWDLLQDQHGHCWAATQTGLLRFSDDLHAPEHIGANDPVLAAPNRVLLERQAAMWVGTVRGLSVVQRQDGGWHTREVTGPNTQPLGYVYTMVEDHTGRLWVGTIGNGLWRETRRGFERVLPNEISGKGNIYAIAPRPDGMVAVLEDNRVWLILNDKQAQVLTHSEDAVAGWSALFTPKEQLMIGSSNGLRELDVRYGLEQRQVRTWLGLAGWEFTTSRSLLRDQKRFWCGLNSGLMVVDWAALERIAEAPAVMLDRVQWINATPKQDGDVYHLEAGKWTMHVSFDAPRFVDEQDLRFRHRLLGFDSTWSEPRTQAEVRYTSLPAGHYTLEVQAHSPLTGWGRIAKLLAVRIRQTHGNHALHNARSFLRQALDENAKLNAQRRTLEQRVHDYALELSRSEETVGSLQAKLDRLVLTDPLTGVSNERHLHDTLRRELKRLRRSQQPLSVIQLAVDDFEAYRETHGESEANQCLRRVASVLVESLRETGDLIARGETERFTVVLPATNASEALVIAEGLRQDVYRQYFPFRRLPRKATLTVSVGVATCEVQQSSSAETLLAQAQEALERAKTTGGNMSAHIALT